MYHTSLSPAQDPHETAKERCQERSECVSLKDKLDECNTRVEGKTRTSETCVEEIIDWLHCVDECVSRIALYMKNTGCFFL